LRSDAMKLATSASVSSGPSDTGKPPVTARLARRNRRAPADRFACTAAG
jgi:hypothetical protein